MLFWLPRWNTGVILSCQWRRKQFVSLRPDDIVLDGICDDDVASTSSPRNSRYSSKSMLQITSSSLDDIFVYKEETYVCSFVFWVRRIPDRGPMQRENLSVYGLENIGYWTSFNSKLRALWEPSGSDKRWLSGWYVSIQHKKRSQTNDLFTSAISKFDFEYKYNFSKGSFTLQQKKIWLS
jgi:hypothetical protein